MLPEEREYVRRQIATILDMPNVFMGGPSSMNLRRASSIMDVLERAGRLVPTTCDHAEWSDERGFGIACPTCGMHMLPADAETPTFLFKK